MTDGVKVYAIMILINDEWVPYKIYKDDSVKTKKKVVTKIREIRGWYRNVKGPTFSIKIINFQEDK